MLNFMGILIAGFYLFSSIVCFAQTGSEGTPTYRMGSAPTDGPITTPPDDEYSDIGTPRRAIPRNLAIPLTWDLRAGYQRSFANPDLGRNLYENGAELGARFFLDDSNFSINLRAQIAFGQGGVDYFSINARTLRLRLALNSNRHLFVSFAPLDFETRVDSSHTITPGRAGRFAYTPQALIGTIFRIGNSHGCVMQLFASTGAMLGVHQTLSNGRAHFLTGAEALAACRHVFIDTTYVHIFTFNQGADVDRLNADVLMMFPVRSLDLGPYFTTTVSRERGADRAPVDSYRAVDRTQTDFSVGLRVRW